MISARRREVWEMMVAGQSLVEIAQHFKVTVKTIERDRDWWEKRLGYQTDKLKKDPEFAAQDVGQTAAKLKKIAEDAYTEYVTGGTAHAKARFLHVATHALVLRHKILADAGYLPKVGHEKEQAATVSISFEARFGKDAPEAVFDNPKSRRKVLEAAYKLINTGIVDEIGTTGEALHATPIEMVPDADDPVVDRPAE